MAIGNKHFTGELEKLTGRTQKTYQTKKAHRPEK